MSRADFPEWWSPKGLAQGLGKSVQSINAKAVREGWRDALTLDGRSMCRNSEGRGKGYEYRIGVLSEVQQDELYTKWAREHAVAAPVAKLPEMRPTDASLVGAFAALSPQKKGDCTGAF